MAKRQRIDTTTGAVTVMQRAVREIEPPAHVPLMPEDLPFWSSILAEKARSEWTAHDLEIAALLARATRRLEAEDALLAVEGSVLISERGAPCQNPRSRAVADMHARVMSYRMTLGIHSRGKNGEARDVNKRREIAKGIERDNPLTDDLLARPATVQ